MTNQTNLKARREAAGLSQAMLAATSGVSTATISRIESANIMVNMTTAHKLAAALDCRVSDLLPYLFEQRPTTRINRIQSIGKAVRL